MFFKTKMDYWIVQSDGLVCRSQILNPAYASILEIDLRLVDKRKYDRWIVIHVRNNKLFQYNIEPQYLKIKRNDVYWL